MDVINILINGDCLQEMDKLILEGVTVDMVLVDPPYNITALKWDRLIPFDEMWCRVKKLIKKNGAICIFGCEPFSSALRISNSKHYKYDWYWEKSKAQNFLNAKKMPLKNVESISVFYKSQPTYNPQGLKPYSKVVYNAETKMQGKNVSAQNGGLLKSKDYFRQNTNYPRQTLKFSVEHGLHPTQKPVPLLEYLIKTYTNEGDTILDFCMGSGSTAIACINTDRKYIMIEKEEQYFNVGKERINKHTQKNKVSII